MVESNMETVGSGAPTLSSMAALPDPEIVRRVRAGDRRAFEILMRRHNQRLYRVARAVLKDEDEVEDVMQQAYVNAFLHLHQFEERAQFSTWLTRIALNEAFRRRRTLQRSVSTTSLPAEHDEERRRSWTR
jgi:RNA polymerase sigma-70 factor (ECF subfamily)